MTGFQHYTCLGWVDNDTNRYHTKMIDKLIENIVLLQPIEIFLLMSRAIWKISKKTLSSKKGVVNIGGNATVDRNIFCKSKVCKGGGLPFWEHKMQKQI